MNTMNRQTIDLGFILRQMPDYEFSMNEFPDRLKLQKRIYLLQSFDIYLGYRFSWYIKGPYCSTLAMKGFELQEIYDEIPQEYKTTFTNNAAQSKFERFLKFVKGRSVDDLEILASLHYLKQGGKLDDENIKKRVMEKDEGFTEPYVESMWMICKSGI